MRRAWIVLSVVAASALAAAAGPQCWNFLTRATYGNNANGTGGSFANTDLCTTAPCGSGPAVTYGVTVQGGQLQLTPVAHNVNQIQLPFDQDAYVLFVGSNQSSGTYGKGSQTMSWFYYNTGSANLTPFLQGGVGPALVDADGDTIMDFFQNKAGARTANGLYSLFDNLPSPGGADLANAFTPRSGGAPSPFSDGGTWPHIPNIIETLIGNGGGIVWENTEDDNDFVAYTSSKNGNILLPLSADLGGSQNGAPDYDVNGDGVIDNDPVTALGQLSGSREFVFNLNSYVDYTSQAQTLGQPSNQNFSSPAMGACTSWNFPGCSSVGQTLWNYPGCAAVGQCLATVTNSYSTSVGWAGGWCTICLPQNGGSYACTNGYSGNAFPESFFDPVPLGQTITSVTSTLYYDGCGPGTASFYINGVNLGNWANDSDCTCGDCSPPATVTYSNAGGIPGYNRGANNSLWYNTTNYSMCMARGYLTFNCSTCSETCAANVCACLATTTAPGGGWWHETYWDSQATKMLPWFGLPAGSWPNGWGDTSYDSAIGTYFTKSMLNSDRALTSGLYHNTGAQLDGINLATAWASPNVNSGWLTAQQSTKLTAAGITLTPEVRYPQVQSAAYAPGGTNYYSPHAILGANSAGAASHAWLIGFEDDPLALAWCSTPLYTCKTPGDFNNLVFWLLSEDGGSAVSQDLSSDCAHYPNSCITSAATISKVSFTNFAPVFGVGCLGSAQTQLLTRADLYYSLDGGATWHLALFPAGTTSLVIDTLSQGYSGYQLRWKVNMVTAQTDSACIINVPPFNVGYEAITAANGNVLGPTYQFTEGLPVANVIVRAQYESESTGGDTSPRGHVFMSRLYDPDNGNKADVPLVAEWDAGAQLNAMGPGGRSIYFFDPTSANASRTFTSAINAANSGDYLWTQLNPFNSSMTKDGVAVNRGCAKVDGKCIFDFAGAAGPVYTDNNVDIHDAIAVANWSLGYSDFYKALPTTAQPWLLGGIFHSSPAVIGPPFSDPWWLNAQYTPIAENQSFALFATANISRKTITMAGASDGLLHAFDTGFFLWGDDPSTPTPEAHGYFQQQGGTRSAGVNKSYGSGNELWALAPQSQLPLLRNHVLNLNAYKPSVNPRATMDGSISVADIYYSNAFHTVAFAGDGEAYPQQKVNPAVLPPAPYTAFGTQPSSPTAWQKRPRYITAVNVTNPSQPTAVWANDWTDTDFWGAMSAAPISPTATSAGSPPTRTWVLAENSGIATAPSNEFVYLINATTGVTVPGGKIQINVGGQSARATGMYGSPALIDSTNGPGITGNGLADRIYVADTLGRIFKINTGTMTSCMIGNMPNNEGIYAPIAIDVIPGASVSIYAGSGSDPTVLTNPSGQTFHFMELSDTDAINTCHTATVVFTVALPVGQKVWTGPVVSVSPTGETVAYVATSGDWSLDPAGDAPDSTSAGHLCSNLGGTLQGYDAGTGNNVVNQALNGDAVSSLRSFDGHLFLDSLTGTTTTFGVAGWNTTPPSPKGAQAGAALLPITNWSEP